MAALLKRVKNITKGIAAPASLERGAPSADRAGGAGAARRARQRARRSSARRPARGDYREAFAGIAQLQPAVAKFFDDVLVMAEDEPVRAARLGLVATLRDLILGHCGYFRDRDGELIRDGEERRPHDGRQEEAARRRRRATTGRGASTEERASAKSRAANEERAPAREGGAAKAAGKYVY